MFLLLTLNIELWTEPKVIKTLKESIVLIRVSGFVCSKKRQLEKTRVSKFFLEFAYAHYALVVSAFVVYIALCIYPRLAVPIT